MGTTKISKVNQFLFWMKKQPKKVKILLASVFVILVVLAVVIVEHIFDEYYGFLFIASELLHFGGLVVLVYKLKVNKSCAGLSLKSQELTALYLISKLSGIGFYTPSVFSILGFFTLAATAWVIYMIRFKLKSTYIKDLDNFPRRYLIAPCAVLAVLIHPYLRLSFVGIGWAFSSFLESVSVMPQLRLMKNAKVAEPFTAHYVFALGLSRFCHCAFWIIQIYQTRGKYLVSFGSTHLWIPSAFIAEVIQTFILSDFCYYYVKSYMDGQLLIRMPI